MDCKERILSNSYADFIVDFASEIVLPEGLDVCYIPVGDGYAVLYQSRQSASGQWEGPYQYRYMPKLYGLMELGEELEAVQLYQEPFDPSALINSGILSVQREPLRLTGQGCIFCCIDTGERVILLLG